MAEMDKKVPSFYLVLSLLSFSSLGVGVLSLGTGTGTGTEPEPPLSVYDILEKFNLPRGLLPDSVKSYSLSEEDGSFEVDLEKPCYVQFDYLVYYEKKITGKLILGSITNLKGIQVQRFFLWLDVDEIRVDLPPSDTIYFTVGIINKKLAASQFQTIHSCRRRRSRTPSTYLQMPTPVHDTQMLLTE